MATGESKSALDILDEAVHLLRLAPAGLLVPFYAGSVPFVLGFLYFCADMSRGAFAHQRAGESALGVALLYLWMKAWQAIFARRLRSRLSIAGGGVAPVGWTRLIATQVGLQPTSLFVLPLASLAVLPFGWVYAFYHSLSVTGDVAAARRQAALWPRQNHALMFIVSLFGLFVALNLALAVFLAPVLLKSLLGVETVISRSPMTFLNTTFFMAVCGLTYLTVGPLLKAAYVLRCFYGDSLTTGEDLKEGLRAVVPAPGRAAALLLLGVALGGAFIVPAAAASAPPVASNGGRRGGATGPVPDARVPPPEIERAIRDVITRREFAWRLPREPRQDKVHRGIVVRFFEAMGETVVGWLDGLGDLIRRVIDWLSKIALGGAARERDQPQDLGWLMSVQGLLAILLAAVACATALLFWRSRREGASKRPVATRPAAAAPDLAVDDGAAFDTPADRWLKRALELARGGDLRQAVRGLYLACLSDLAQRDLLTLARFKSNRDYESELRRRGRARPELPPLFAESVAQFEKVWYGRHEPTEELFRAFVTNFERMRARAES